MLNPQIKSRIKGVWDRPTQGRRPGSSWRFVKVQVLFVCPDNVDALLLLATLDQSPGLAGVTLARASDDQSASELLEAHNYDVILIFDKPAEAIETMNIIRLDQPMTPVVIIAPTQDESTAIRAIKAGAQDFLLRDEVTPALVLRALRYAVERHRLQLELRSLSLTDELTGLSNRRGFFTLAEQMRKQALRQRVKLVLFYVDLDGLKSINDAFGHVEGDLVIASAGQLLHETFRESDLVCRIGGDEFVALTIEDEESIVESAISRIADRMDEWNQNRQSGPQLSLSIGVSIFEPIDSHSLENALMAADSELYRQKRLKNRNSLPRESISLRVSRDV